MFHRSGRTVLLCYTLLAASVHAATTIDLSVEASRPAANDEARATLFAEATAQTPGESARRVNAEIADALAAARAQPKVSARTGNSHTYPVYAKGGGRIDAWRMRSEIILESGDTTALSELLGRLQAKLGVAGVTLSPSAATRRKVEEAALLDAVTAFKARAKLVADSLGKPYRIRHLSLGGQSAPPPMPVFRAAPMAAMEAAPMPIDGGESQIRATVSGQIELIDGGAGER